MGERPILIPFTIESYVTDNRNAPDKMCARISPDYAQVEYDSYLGGNMEPAPFTVRPPLSAGIHLHFILPECFRRARQRDSAEARRGWEYANVPDRWVVTRLLMDRERKIVHKSFLVESNYIGLDNRGSVAVPYLEDPLVSHRYLGRTYEYGQERKGSGSYIDGLTAMGAGNPYFMAYYPDCHSVFGFYDDMRGVQEGCCVTYFVCGYFSDRAKDPLYHATEENFGQIMKELGLEVKTIREPGTQKETASFWANESVLFGEVCHIHWEGYQGKYPDPRAKGEIKCGVGNTSAEVISAVIARRMEAGQGKGENWERLFNALQYETADELEDIDGIAKTEDMIHAQSFLSHAGGNIRRLDYDGTEADLLPEEAGRLMSKVNEMSRQYAKKSDEIAYWRDNAYAAWYSYMLHYEGDESESAKKVKMRNEIFRICEEVIPALEEELAQLEKEEGINLGKLQDAIAGKAIKLTQVPEGVFYEPKEPVLMLYGDGVKRSHAFDGEEKLLCQEMPITSLFEDTRTLSRSDIMKYTDEIPCIIPHFDDYLIQAVCLDDLMVKAIGEAEGLPGLICDKDAVSPLACREFEQSWQTFMLEWRVRFYPSRTLSDHVDDSMDDWEFDGLDYDSGKEHGKQAVVYAGRTMVTPHSLYRFRYTVEKYMKESGMEEEEIEKILREVENLPVLSQNLDGFNSMLLARIRSVQAPVIGNDGDERLTQAILKIAPQEKLAVNDVVPCFPLRAGHMRLEKVNLLSTFGMIRNVSTVSAPLVCSEVMGECQDLEEHTSYALLRPRIMGEARFCFDFMETGHTGLVAQEPGTSPICGMIMPELLNARLAFYSAQGRYYGALKTVYREGRRLAKWLSPPGQVQIPFEDVSFADEDLKNMIAYLLKDSDNGGTAYEDLLLLIGRQQEKALPSGLDMGGELPYIWGRPLAVFQCRVALARKGGLAYSYLREDYAKYDTLAVEKIAFPLMAGDMSRTRSGIVGYFENYDYGKFYPAYHAEKFASDYIRFEEHTGLYINHSPKMLTMIAEIGNPLYFQTGILPVSRYDLPAVYTRFVSEMKLCFEADSVMCVPEAPQLPVPAVKDGASWYFSYVDNQLGEERNRSKKITCVENIFTTESNIVCDGYLDLER